jgi:hypothetical protein
VSAPAFKMLVTGAENWNFVQLGIGRMGTGHCSAILPVAVEHDNENCVHPSVLQ